MGDELLFQEGMLHFYYLRFAIDVVVVIHLSLNFRCFLTA
jgi:hypothetical protein